MAATLTAAVVDCAPGNTLSLAGTGLTAGGLASVKLANQGVLTPAPLTIPATFTGTAVAFTVPDGITSDTLTVTASDGTSATCELVVCAQYLQASQYAATGEGTDTSTLAAGVLDEVLRDASGYIDTAIGTTLRLLQQQEDHANRDSRRIWPLRGPRREIPIASLDDLRFITSNAIQTVFNVSGAVPDVYLNPTDGYIEVQTYAVGTALLLAQIQTLGTSANQWRLTYTAGYRWTRTPRAIRRATAMIATEMLTYASIIGSGLGGLSRVRKGAVQYDRRNEEYQMPAPVKALLTPYMGGGW